MKKDITSKEAFDKDIEEIVNLLKGRPYNDVKLLLEIALQRFGGVATCK
ncbi:hypothetical protein SD427_13835 [Chryseobacterium sp. JJR-5R]|nr:hypothetical protein [Chryseobacterium sp. JJR-5R]WPO81845.1 hypothetical protein SD427_13835 [Chryseobacterium sp. JJR-5R]